MIRWTNLNEIWYTLGSDIDYRDVEISDNLVNSILRTAFRKIDPFPTIAQASITALWNDSLKNGPFPMIRSTNLNEIWYTLSLDIDLWGVQMSDNFVPSIPRTAF